MLRLLHDTHYDFIRWWRWALGLTVAFIILGLGALTFRGVNRSIEFTGGTLMQLEFAKPVDVAVLRGVLDSAGINGAEIQQFGTNREYTVRAQETAKTGTAGPGAETRSRQIENLLTQRYGAANVKVVRTEAVGPKVGTELTRDAILALLLSFLVTTVKPWISAIAAICLSMGFWLLRDIKTPHTWAQSLSKLRMRLA